MSNQKQKQKVVPNITQTTLLYLEGCGKEAEARTQEKREEINQLRCELSRAQAEHDQAAADMNNFARAMISIDPSLQDSESLNTLPWRNKSEAQAQAKAQ